MAHEKTYACTKPSGDGCDGEHTPPMDHEARARQALLSLKGLRDFDFERSVVELANMLREERERALEEAAKKVEWYFTRQHCVSTEPSLSDMLRALKHGT